jgi:sugar phosphate isomerase/epimerase
MAQVGYLRGDNIGIVHVNDYPAEPPRETITDASRVFPGDGVAPSAALARRLHAAGYTGYLSLELFIEAFPGRTALEVAQEGLAKMRAAYGGEA